VLADMPITFPIAYLAFLLTAFLVLKMALLNYAEKAPITGL
jgi:hypothetical protein